MNESTLSKIALIQTSIGSPIAIIVFCYGTISKRLEILELAVLIAIVNAIFFISFLVLNLRTYGDYEDEQRSRNCYLNRESD